MARKKKTEDVVEVVKETFDTPEEVVKPVVETFADITVDEMLPVSDIEEVKPVVEEIVEEIVEEVKDPAVGEVLFPLVVGLVADGYQASDIKARVKAIVEKREIHGDLTKFYEQRFTKDMILVLSELK